MTLKQAFDELLFSRSYCEFHKKCESQQIEGGDTLCINSTRRDRKNQICYSAMLDYQIAKEAERNQCPGTA